jgi:hypothetical protein
LPIAHPDLATPAPRRPALPRRSLLGLVVLTLGLHLWLMDRWHATTAGDGEQTEARPLPGSIAPQSVETLQARPAAPTAAVHEAPAVEKLLAPPPPPPTPPRPIEPARRPPSLAQPRPEPAPVSWPERAPEQPQAQAAAVPPSTQLDYRLSRGALVGRGRIDWSVDGPRYRMRLEARVPVVGRILAQVSEGQIEPHGLAPERHTEQRLRRSERAVSFVREGDHPRILFSAREGEAPLEPGAQDRLSWIAQLTARLDAPGQAPGDRIVMPVAGVGGEVQHWVFTLLDRDEAGRWHLRREPDGPHDTRAEVWTLPQPPHWPQRLRLSEADGDTLELLLQPAAEPPP